MPLATNGVLNRTGVDVALLDEYCRCDAYLARSWYSRCLLPLTACTWPGNHLQRSIDSLAECCRYSMGCISKQHHTRGCQAGNLKRAAACVPWPLSELLRNLIPHILQHSSWSAGEYTQATPHLGQSVGTLWTILPIVYWASPQNSGHIGRHLLHHSSRVDSSTPQQHHAWG